MLDHWQPLLFAEYQAINMANHYFTSWCQNPNAVPIDFHTLVDPNRMLCDMAVGDLVHCEENDVHYLELYINKDLQEKWVIYNANPMAHTDFVCQIQKVGPDKV